MLTLTFVISEDHEKIKGDDRVDIDRLQHFAEGKNSTLVVDHKDGQGDVSFVSEILDWNAWMVVDFFICSASHSHIRSMPDSQGRFGVEPHGFS